MGLPRQHLSNSCGVFVLMYSLSFVTAGPFDFTEPDVPCIRRWWCLLLLENFPLRSDEETRATKKQMRHIEKNAQKANVTPDLHLLNLPMEILEMILLEVVLQDGDSAYLNLSLTCSSFSAIVNTDLFRQKAHYEWLDSVVNWGIWSETSKAELRVPFEIKECQKCKTFFKSCSGFYGNGKCGCLRGFYDSIEDPDSCFMCQY
ncbi:uncharacterized protein [Pseudorasbora parva]|uniref:uncharacterized protein n=1 Tax=Pseudorasbora parva TaxID=51549 RepID=UPI00351E32E3